MDVGSSPLAARLTGAPSCLAVAPPPPPPEPCTPAELRALVHGGLTESDACEQLLAQSARVEGTLDLAIGDGLAALLVGDRLISLGFSSLRDYAREVLDVAERTAESMAHLSRGLRSRPLLRAAVRAGEVRPRNAQTVLPVAVGEAEAAWVERARTETVRALEKAVRAVRAGEEDEEWARFRVRLSPEDRETVDEALAIAGKIMPGSTRPNRLEAMAQEYLGEHALEAGDDGGGAAGGSFRPDGHDRLEQRKAELELESDRWSYLPGVANVRAPDEGSLSFEQVTSAREIHRGLRHLAARRASWDRVLGYCAYMVKRSGLHRVAGFASFEHYCSERLGLAGRTVEERAAVEKRILAGPGAPSRPAERARVREGPHPLAPARSRHRGVDPPRAGADVRGAPRRGGGTRRGADACGEGAACQGTRPDRAAPPGRVPGGASDRRAAPRRRKMPRPGGPALRRCVETVREEGAEPLAEGPRARPRPMPDAGVQPEGGARSSRRAALARRRRHAGEPRRAVRLPSPARHPRRLHPRAGVRAGPPRLGGGREGLERWSGEAARRVVLGEYPACARLTG